MTCTTGAIDRNAAPCGRQLLLFSQSEPLDAERFRELLERGLGAPVRLVLTRNRTSVLTFQRERDGSYEVRLQRVFLEAPDDVVEAIVAFVRKPVQRARERVVSYFSSRPDAERRGRRPKGPPAEIGSAGNVFDLAEIRASLNARYFEGQVASAISWAAGAPRALSRGTGRTIRFGSYLAASDLIRIHPALDAEWVPRFFVESIVYHEMLHAVIPIERDACGRRIIHPTEFKRRERAFHAYDQAATWERANLRRLLGARELADQPSRLISGSPPES